MHACPSPHLTGPAPPITRLELCWRTGCREGPRHGASPGGAWIPVGTQPPGTQRFARRSFRAEDGGLADMSPSSVQFWFSRTHTCPCRVSGIVNSQGVGDLPSLPVSCYLAQQKPNQYLVPRPISSPYRHTTEGSLGKRWH